MPNDDLSGYMPIATPAQAAEIRRLIAIILANDSAEDRDEALTVALADPVAALTSFRQLVADLT